MSFYNDSEYAASSPGTPARRPASGLSVFIVVGGFILLGIALFRLPELRKHWLETDPEFILQMRAVEARAEADALYRRKEAELKADAEAAASRLAKLDLPASPIRTIVAKAGPSVVNISSVQTKKEELTEPGRRRLFPFPPEDAEQRSEGSGVLVRLDDDRRAYVMTNSHVVRGADQLDITLSSGRMIRVKRDQVYADTSTDLALVWFEAGDMDHLAVAEFGEIDDIQVGDPVVAIGSPFGLRQSVTAGILSGKGRVNPQLLVETIQTDAAINPGNSGGPLLDLKGRIIGINTLIYTRNGGSQGVGFAIPSDTAQMVLEQLVKPPHRVVWGFIGVMMQDVREEAGLRMGVNGGVMISSVGSDTPAAEAGLKTGDVIIRYNRHEVTNMNQLRRMVMQTQPGTGVAVNLIRMEDGKPTDVAVRITVTERPSR